MAYCGIAYYADIADEGTPWECAADPEPQYFETLKEAILFRDKLLTGELKAALKAVVDSCLTLGRMPDTCCVCAKDVDGDHRHSEGCPVFLAEKLLG